VRKRPRQERARITMEAILEAGTEVFAGRGYARTNTNEIARRAGISVGSLYQYFPSKDAILMALLERHLRAVEATIRGCLPDLANDRVPLRRAVRGLLGRLVAVHEANPALSRAVEQPAGEMPKIPEAYRLYLETFVSELESLLRRRRDVRRADPALMAHLLYAAAEALTGWLAHGPSGRFERSAALRESVELLCRYVERPASGSLASKARGSRAS